MYVAGFVIPVPQDRMEAYRRWAENSARIFGRYGCLEIVECWEDFVPGGKQTDFRRAVAAKEGEKIVFSWQKPGGQGHQLYSLSLTQGGEPRPLTQGVSEDFDPVWSPDGSKICFMRRGKGESAIYLIDRDTGQTRRVTTIQYDSTWASRLGWLGPGRLCVTDRSDTPGYRALEVDLETGAKRRLVPGNLGNGEGTARLSPNGKELLFGRAFGKHNFPLSPASRG